jgi:hypothetical protein
VNSFWVLKYSVGWEYLFNANVMGKSGFHLIYWLGVESNFRGCEVIIFQSWIQNLNWTNWYRKGIFFFVPFELLQRSLNFQCYLPYRLGSVCKIAKKKNCLLPK